MEAKHYRPAVSIIIPFAPKMRLKNELAHSLKMASDKVEFGVNGKLFGSEGQARNE
jgi:hypothetical protein